MKRTRGLALLVVVASALFALSRANAAALVDCPFNAGGGDFVDRGFYIQNYAGSTLKSVRIAHHTLGTAGPRTIQMTARVGGYGGVLLGTAFVNRTIDADWTISNFDFADVAVAPGSTIAFAQTVTAGVDDITYNTGAEPCDATQTNGTSPVLDTFRRGSVGLVVDGSPEAPGTTLLLSCPFDEGGGDNLNRGFYIDDYPGTTLDSITVRFDGSGPTELELQARLYTFDGFILGTVNLVPNLTTSNEVTFPFNVAVPAGARIVFLPRQISGATAFIQTGYASLGVADTTTCPRVVETTAQTPPVSTFRRGSIAMKVIGRTASNAPIPAVEYFHNGFGHYFMTAQADEIAGLDGGAFGGVFTRTGREFDVFDGPVGGAIPVCRFFTTPGNFGTRSSHFYTSDPVECAGVKLNPNWIYEKIAFYVKFYDGACPVGHVAVFRIYNNGMTGAPNHRYTTDLALYNQFINTFGWAPEGVKFCVPT
ncbi:MAG TPA: hypothetical protein VII68_12230 [Casimicrobiaceae bacterium]|jgi:hypothetical protein